MKKQHENQGAAYDASAEDVVMVRGEDGQMYRVEVEDDAEND